MALPRKSAFPRQHCEPPGNVNYFWTALVVGMMTLFIWQGLSQQGEKDSNNSTLVASGIAAFFVIDAAIDVYRRKRFPKTS